MQNIVINPVSQKQNNKHQAHKLDEGAQIFVESAQVLLNFVQAGIVANSSGNLKDGIPFIVAGLNELAALSSHTQDQQRSYQEMVDFLLTRSDDELNHILSTARNRALARR